MKIKIVLLLAFLFLFAGFSMSVIQKADIISSIDTSGQSFAVSLRSPTADIVNLSATDTENLLGSALIFALFAGILFIKKHERYLVIFASTSIFGIGLAALIKNLVGRIRPAGYLIKETGFSYPSEHALMATIFLLSALFLVSPLIQNKSLKAGFILISCILFPLVAFSRIYLFVHYPSDVLGGILLGVAVYLFSDIVITAFSLHEGEKSGIHSR
jgi:undecaprenyl-diphosphatase